MKTVLKAVLKSKIAGMFLGNRSDSVHKYGHAVMRVLPYVLSIEAIPCLCKPLKSLQISRTSQTKLN